MNSPDPVPPTDVPPAFDGTVQTNYLPADAGGFELGHISATTSPVVDVALALGIAFTIVGVLLLAWTLWKRRIPLEAPIAISALGVILLVIAGPAAVAHAPAQADAGELGAWASERYGLDLDADAARELSSGGEAIAQHQGARYLVHGATDGDGLFYLFNGQGFEMSRVDSTQPQPGVIEPGPPKPSESGAVPELVVPEAPAQE